MITTFSIPPYPTKGFRDRLRIAAKLMDFKLTEVFEITFYSEIQQPISMADIVVDTLRHDGYEMQYCRSRWIESQDEKIIIETSGLEAVADRFKEGKE